MIIERIKNLKISATLAINKKSKKLEREGKKIYKLGLGQSPFPVPESVVNSLRLHAPEKAYLPVKGLYELRKAVAEFHIRKDGVNATHKNVMIGPGSKELLFLLQLVFDGEIILPSPCWVSYLPQAKIIGNDIKVIHTTFEDRWRILSEQVDEIGNMNKHQLLILNYPGNPEGASYSELELKKISEICREKNIIILSDEIYGELNHKNNHVSIAKFYPEGTIISSGLSKWCGAGGWRLGTFTFPQELRMLMEAMASVASETYTSVCAPIQFAAVQAFKGGPEIEKYLTHSKKILANLGNQCTRILSNANIKVHPPVGAFYLFADFCNFKENFAERGIFNSQQLAEKLLDETGVAILPGIDFLRPEKELTIRISYVDFDGAKALIGSRETRLIDNLPENFNMKYCPKVIEAMKKIVEWTQQ
jgi:aspartate aminotransferase